MELFNNIFLIFSISCSTSVTIPNPSLGIVKADISLQKQSQKSSLLTSVKLKQLLTTLLRTAHYLQMGLVLRINDFLFKESCYLFMKWFYNVFPLP